MNGGFKYIFAALIIGNAFAEECQKSQENVGNKLLDQTFGMALTPNDILTNILSPFHHFQPFLSPFAMHDYFRPWRQLASLSKDLGSTIKSDKDKFQVNLDVQHFSPEEISVKTADGYVVIEAKHEEKQDEHGFVSRQFVRKYTLPEGAESENVVSELSSDGILTVTAPRKVVDDKGERVVPITKTGPVRQEPKKEAEEGSCQAPGQSCNKK
ncbi:protein lethal(2)essential for life-like [Plodia interpunctella]|uniref:protein lethal(2)essential for life-like n=1 Tax=Plodia interpunctella TaxID=58824 RepID=UPI0023675D62|nr:protein lethal(2)essential for life-like [Plodia interpunctella]